jgi:hypothetical protein
VHPGFPNAEFGMFGAGAAGVGPVWDENISEATSLWEEDGTVKIRERLKKVVIHVRLR